jgi:hypothetical protein
MEEPTYSKSIFVRRSADDLYDMVSDVTRMGEWSPVCKSCWWDEGDSAVVGAWFTGHNETPDRTWDTRSQVMVADRGREFAFLVGQAWIRWGYTFAAEEEGTLITESWRFLTAGIERFHQRYGSDAPAQVEDRIRAAHEGIPGNPRRNQAVGGVGFKFCVRAVTLNRRSGLFTKWRPPGILRQCGDRRYRPVPRG